MENTYQKNKGGRPSINAAEKKIFKLYCYLDETENDAFIQFKKMNIGTNSFHLKNALFQYIGNENNQVKKINKETIKLITDLNRLAGNVNQVAKHLNKNLTFDGASKIEFMKNQKEILQLITEIKQTITK
ncbi:MAG: plasmid mobilization relaxosome protein MobC [Flavobacteriales bacterium]|nr:MAG: plasmid mobilization relaxosome protein MobC [Flavobacteriales bacterium]